MRNPSSIKFYVIGFSNQKSNTTVHNEINQSTWLGLGTRVIGFGVAPQLRGRHAALSAGPMYPVVLRFLSCGIFYVEWKHRLVVACSVCVCRGPYSRHRHGLPYSGQKSRSLRPGSGRTSMSWVCWSYTWAWRARPEARCTGPVSATPEKAWNGLNQVYFVKKNRYKNIFIYSENNYFNIHMSYFQGFGPWQASGFA